jgi:hypothetical protein
LRGSGLDGTISPHIGNLTQLQHLDLSQNNLLGEIPVSLGSCTDLRTMNLSLKQLSGSLFPYPLGHLSKLKVFNVRHNNLTGVTPMALSNYGGKRGGLRMPAPRPHKPRALLRAYAAARMPPLALCGRQRQPASSRSAGRPTRLLRRTLASWEKLAITSITN